MKKATILIATRNRASELRLGLESIKKKNYQDVEVLVIDDASTDKTIEVLGDYASMIRPIRIARDGGYRHNPGYVLNMGHDLARADIVIEQGGEVCHLTDCVTPLLRVCRPGIVAIARVHNGSVEEMGLLASDIEAGKYEYPKNFEPDTVRTNGDRWAVPKVGLRRIQLYCGVERPAPFLFLGAIHRKDFEAVGGYDEKIMMNNDGDLANRLQAKGVKFCFVGNAVAFHLTHGKS